MKQRSTLQIVLSIVMAWMTVQMIIRFLGMFLTGLIVVCIGLMLVIIYALRFERRFLARWYNTPVTRQMIDGVCRITRQQPPTETSLQAPGGGLRLKTGEDFDWCARKVKGAVFGHDAAVDVIAERLKKNVLVRQRSAPRADLPPLGVFLVAGPPGIGKRTLALRLGQYVFEKSGATVLDMNQYAGGDPSVTQLLGARGVDGDLSAPIRMSPRHVIVLENIDAASPKVQEAIQTLLASGSAADQNGSGTISFQNCVVFLTTSRPVQLLDEADAVGESVEDITGRICAATECSQSLVSLATCAVLHAPDDITKAKVVLQTMISECQKYRLSLEYVEPDIVADEVRRISDDLGFEHTPVRVARKLADPIHMAAQHSMQSLVLTTDMMVSPGQSSANPHRKPQPSQVEIAAT